MTGDEFAKRKDQLEKQPCAFITRHSSLITRHRISNPFQGGVGFSTLATGWPLRSGRIRSQSLSGWGGVFNLGGKVDTGARRYLSQSLSGWGGVFNAKRIKRGTGQAISRNPFQGGVGFSTSLVALRGKVKDYKSQSLSGWGGVFNKT